MGAPAVLFQRGGWRISATLLSLTVPIQPSRSQRKTVPPPREGENCEPQGLDQRHAAQGQAKPDGRKYEGDGQTCIGLAGKDEIGEDAADEEHRQSQEPTIGFRLECASTRRKTR